MEVKYRLLIVSFTMTTILLVAILLFGSVLNNNREDNLKQDFDRVLNDFNEIQTLTLLADAYNDPELSCLAFKSKLSDLDSYLWDLGSVLDKYRSASEEFFKKSYYKKQKILFNQHEMTYFVYTKNLISRCNLSKQTILYFYEDEANCSNCDAQSFILRDIGLNDEDLNGDNREVAIFSFDVDLGVDSIDLLTEYYGFENYPCLVINDNPYCGLKSEKQIMDLICEDNDLDICTS